MSIVSGWCLSAGYAPRILIVEDEGEMAQILADLVRKGGAEVRTEGDGSAGLEAVEAFDPDVIIADLKMPLVRGDEMLVELRQRGFKKPVIVLTGYGDEELAVQAQRYDAFDFLNKPVPKEILMAVIQKAIRMENERLEKEMLIQDLLAALSQASGISANRQLLEKKAAQRVKSDRTKQA